MSNDKPDFFNENSHKLLKVNQGNSRFLKKFILIGAIVLYILPPILYKLPLMFPSQPIFMYVSGMIYVMNMYIGSFIVMAGVIYFVILAARYIREKSGMDRLDKMMFYTLLIFLLQFLYYR